MADEENNENESFQPKTGPGKNPLIAILMLLNIVFMGVIIYMQYVGHQKIVNTPSVQDIVKDEMKAVMDASEETGEAIEQDGILFPLEGFAANLAQGDGPRRYLRVNAVLKFSKDSNEEEFKARKPQIRDTIISIINSKRPTDLLKLEGKNFLKEEIKSSINSFLVDGQVVDVFYVSFQIH